MLEKAIQDTEAAQTRKELADAIRPVRAEHDAKHTSVETMEPACPFCRGDLT